MPDVDGRIVAAAKAIRRALTVKPDTDEPRFGPGAHCVICGAHGRWNRGRGVILCQRHLDAIERGEL